MSLERWGQGEYIPWGEDVSLKRCVPRKMGPKKRCSLGRKWALGKDGADDRMWARVKTFLGEKVGPGRGWG